MNLVLTRKDFRNTVILGQMSNAKQQQLVQY